MDIVNNYDAPTENNLVFYGFNNPNLIKVSKNYLDNYMGVL